jgi:hypothetical protein
MRAAAVLVALLTALPASGQTITGARFAEPTTRYPHGVLGDTVEYGALVLQTDRGPDLRIVLPMTRVFEDTEPRLADLDGDGRPEVIAVESHAERGSRLAVLGTQGLIATTGWIGQRFRWLAPVGAVDLDRDGRVEVAFVDRPHLAKVLRVVRMDGRALTEVASVDGVSNHRVGDPEISGGIRDCGEGPEMVLPSADWTAIVTVAFRDGALTTRTLGAHEGPVSLAAAMECR